MNNFLEGTIDRFEGAIAVIILNDGQQINWPKAQLADDILPGQIVKIYLSPDEESTAGKNALAKDVLNEILQTEE